MKLISINEVSAVSQAVNAIHKSPILVQLPSVFVLLAAPTSQGAQQLDGLKARLGGKNYGTAIGSLDKFMAQAQTNNLPTEFTCMHQFEALAGAFIRLQFRDESFQSQTIRNGTHQGLLLPGIYQNLFKAIEASFETHSPDAIWNNRNYGAPLCTSCNMSGDPEGSIVEFDKALHFAHTRGIDLFITASQTATEKGSYPIFGFSKHRVSIHREGPGLDAFRAKIPASLRNW